MGVLCVHDVCVCVVFGMLCVPAVWCGCVLCVRVVCVVWVCCVCV